MSWRFDIRDASSDSSTDDYSSIEDGMIGGGHDFCIPSLLAGNPNDGCPAWLSGYCWDIFAVIRNLGPLAVDKHWGVESAIPIYRFKISGLGAWIRAYGQAFSFASDCTLTEIIVMIGFPACSILGHVVLVLMRQWRWYTMDSFDHALGCCWMQKPTWILVGPLIYHNPLGTKGSKYSTFWLFSGFANPRSASESHPSKRLFLRTNFTCKQFLG